MSTETAIQQPDTNTSTGTNQGTKHVFDKELFDTKLLEAFLKEVTRRQSGFTMHVETQDNPVLIYGGIITNVRVNSAWIVFSVDGVSYRTKNIDDRNKFYAWYQSDTPEPFSKAKGKEHVFGPPDVTFIKMLGVRGS